MKFLEAICWLIVLPGIVVVVVLGLGGIVFVLLYNKVNPYGSFAEYFLFACLAEIPWLFFLAYLSTLYTA
jgi:hypothetical protein